MGMDIGSTTSKGVILQDGTSIVASSIVAAGTGTRGPQRTLESLFKQSDLKETDITRTVVTGYGRLRFDQADQQISELSCHAKGAHYIYPDVRIIIDIGGQDAKALKLDSKGQLMDFAMNDKCAAGTGRFLDAMARVLEVDVSELSKLADQSQNSVSISSTCTVFAESEVISHLSDGKKPEDIAAGVDRSISKRVSSLAKRIGIEREVTMTGGVARNSNLVRFMEKAIGGIPIKVSPYAQLMGAIGAAIYAWEQDTGKRLPEGVMITSLEEINS
ncbi:acyl-CoA dehydratase activase [Sporolactobacillus sp. CQH2019]|uniref:acyl-CoA dehydratase activase n=1 Tax=Sporolactobacillus sp. CQH2019 TaxID=3023512 RepID=UPI0023688508|nr:acyl-CoA dehydratase activase [Sporolactobacillus sp. CQH2019]MDD9147547.1 acyl-CoA dehydratase activase [Sporolactobacillus sp. CQH2019]